MQYLANKLNFRFSQTKIDQSSPFNKYIDDIQNKRSRLFPDRRRIPGRKLKYIAAIIIVVQAFTIMRLLHAKALIKKKAQQQVALTRKITPYFQASVVQQYTTLKHRWDLLAKEVLGQEFVRKSHFHNKDISWIPVNKDYYTMARAGFGRYTGSPFQYLANRGANGYQIKNI